MSLHEVTFLVPRDDDWAYTVKCLEPTGCAIWVLCLEDGCNPTEDEEDDGEYTRHGRIHRSLDVGWCLEPIKGEEVCATRDDWTGSIGDGMCEIWHHGVKEIPGTYKVSIEYYGDGDWDAYLIKENHV